MDSKDLQEHLKSSVHFKECMRISLLRIFFSYFSHFIDTRLKMKLDIDMFRGKDAFASIPKAQKDFEIVIDLLNGEGKENTSHSGKETSHKGKERGAEPTKRAHSSPILVRENGVGFKSGPKPAPPKQSGMTPLQVRLRKLVGVDLRSRSITGK
jgi:hypothetical protein